jgi:hypothetical protein
MLLHRSLLFGQSAVDLVVLLLPPALKWVVPVVVGVVDQVVEHQQLEVLAHRDKEIMVELEVLPEMLVAVVVLVVLVVMQLPQRAEMVVLVFSAQSLVLILHTLAVPVVGFQLEQQEE